MNQNTSSISTAKAGQLAAGQALDHPPSVASLLAAVSTVADALALTPVLERRRSAAHAARAAVLPLDDLAEDHEIAEYRTEIERLDRDVMRAAAGIERLNARREELATAERRAAARARVKGSGAAAAKRAEARVGRYVAIARELAELLADQDADQAEVIGARAEADAAGIGEEAAGLVLPRESRCRSEVSEIQEIVTQTRAPGTYGANGQRLDGRPVEFLVSRRRELVVLTPRVVAPDLTKVRIRLPSPDAVGVALLDSGQD